MRSLARQLSEHGDVLVHRHGPLFQILYLLQLDHSLGNMVSTENSSKLQSVDDLVFHMGFHVSIPPVSCWSTGFSARWSTPSLRLWWSVFDGISSYGTVAAWGSHLGYSWSVAINGKGHVMMNRLSITLASSGARFKG
jgi:hypothetical protein